MLSSFFTLQTHLHQSDPCWKALQARVLELITPEKVEQASLLDLVNVFCVLSKAEAAIRGKASFKIKGLPDYLIELDRLEKEDSKECND